jgi:hypothetical protein
MKRLVLAGLVLASGACTSAPLQLPDDPLERAAACTAARTLELREGKQGDGPVTFAGATEIIHFAMLYAAEDAVEVDPRRLDAVKARSERAVAELAGQNWASLVEPCNASYPETQKDPASLPGDPFEAGMTCYALGDFLARSVQASFPDEQRALAGMAERALTAAQPALRERARDDNAEAQRIANGYAARAFKAGRPTLLLGQCRRRFPSRG